MAFRLAVNCSAGANEFTFTVSGAIGGGTVVGARTDGSKFGSEWSTLWTFLADGTSPAIALSPGVWWFTALNGSVLSQAYLYHVLNLDDALAIQSRTIVADTIRASAVRPLADRVYEMQDPIDYLKTYPAVYCTFDNVVELDTGEGTNLRTHWVYPVKVRIAMRKDTRVSPKHQRMMMKWRQLYLEGFDWLMPGNDGSIEYCRSIPGPEFQQYIFNPGEHLVTCSMLTVNCHVRRPRGFPVA